MCIWESFHFCVKGFSLNPNVSLYKESKIHGKTERLVQPCASFSAVAISILFEIGSDRLWRTSHGGLYADNGGGEEKVAG